MKKTIPEPKTERPGFNKMKQINFTATEILPSLLDKSKTQTIRQVKYKLPNDDTFEVTGASIEVLSQKEDGKGNIIVDTKIKGDLVVEEKPAKFKVGDVVEMVTTLVVDWSHLDSVEKFDDVIGDYEKKLIDLPLFIKISPKLIDEESCRFQGLTKEKYKAMLKESTNSLIFKGKNVTLGNFYSFGKVEIIAVFQIEMRRDKEDGNYHIWKGNKPYHKRMLAEEEGFSSAEEMFSYFNENYDLSTPKKFWCYKYRWLE